MDVLWRVTTNNDTLYVWAKDWNDANATAQASMHYDEKILHIERV